MEQHSFRLDAGSAPGSVAWQSAPVDRVYHCEQGDAFSKRTQLLGYFERHCTTHAVAPQKIWTLRLHISDFPQVHLRHVLNCREHRLFAI
jgi:hypothetical protein